MKHFALRNLCQQIELELRVIQKKSYLHEEIDSKEVQEKLRFAYQIVTNINYGTPGLPSEREWHNQKSCCNSIIQKRCQKCNDSYLNSFWGSD